MILLKVLCNVEGKEESGARAECAKKQIWITEAPDCDDCSGSKMEKL